MQNSDISIHFSFDYVHKHSTIYFSVTSITCIHVYMSVFYTRAKVRSDETSVHLFEYMVEESMCWQ